VTDNRNRKISEEHIASIVSRSGGSDLQECLTCDRCASTCFLTEAYPDTTPREVTRKVWAKQIEDLADSEFLWACTLCTRCMVDCPKNLHLDCIVRLLRGVSRQRGNGPTRLEEGLKKIRDTGNTLGMDTEEFVDTIQWLSGEAAGDIEGLDEDFQVPMDKQGAEFLYIPNPREFTSAPYLFSVYLKFFLAIGADWTYASNLSDISNWAYLMGDDETNLVLVRKAVDTARQLGVKTLVSTECGHGLKILRKDASEMIGEPLGFNVISVVELANDYFKAGRLKLKKGAVDRRVTYHDPCDVSRKLGVYEPPRELLRHVCREFVEMEPHSLNALCCGGGGSVGQNTDMGKKRLQNAKGKRDQIVATGADVVTTSCQNCLAQLADIRDFYQLPVEVKTVMELVAQALDE
jgi:Fe-S oxidoreductase